MKLRGGALPEEEVYESLVGILVETFGVPRKSIRPDARITEDLGVYGDDAVEFLEAVDARFEMDWGGLRSDIHFGAEGSPRFWDRDAAAYYEPQPVTLERMVRELRAGSWSGTRLVPVSPEKRAVTYGCGWILTAALLSLLGLSIYGVMG